MAYGVVKQIRSRGSVRIDAGSCCAPRMLTIVLEVAKYFCWKGSRQGSHVRRRFAKMHTPVNTFRFMPLFLKKKIKIKRRFIIELET